MWTFSQKKEKWTFSQKKVDIQSKESEHSVKRKWTFSQKKVDNQSEDTGHSVNRVHYARYVYTNPYPILILLACRCMRLPVQQNQTNGVLTELATRKGCKTV